MTIIKYRAYALYCQMSVLEFAEVGFMCESNVYIRDEEDEKLESNVYIRDEEDEKLIMEDVAQLKDHDGRIWIVDLFGEEKEIEGKVQEISFLDHKVFISPKK